MPTQRVKGQDCSIVVLRDSELVSRIDAVQSSDWEFELDLLEEDYLGETSTRHDSIFKALNFELVVHATNEEIVDLTNSIVGRAQRRAGAPVRVDITASLIFPNGDFPTIVAEDAYFDSIPMSIGARDEYVSWTLSGKAGDYRIVR